MKYLGMNPYIVVRKMLDKINNAKQNGIEFDLDLKDFHNLFNKGTGLCAYSGKEFSNNPDVTIERINPKKGYVRGNVCLVKDSCNTAKSILDKFLHSDLINLETKEVILKLALKIVRNEIKENALEKERREANDETRASRLSEMAKAMRGIQ